MSKAKKQPREIEAWTIPDIKGSFAEGEITISFIRSEPQFFFISFPREGHTIPVPTKELKGAIACLKDIMLAGGKKG